MNTTNAPSQRPAVAARAAAPPMTSPAPRLGTPRDTATAGPPVLLATLAQALGAHLRDRGTPATFTQLADELNIEDAGHLSDALRLAVINRTVSELRDGTYAAAENGAPITWGRP